MKRYAALLLTAALVTSLTACNWDKNMDSSSSGELSSSSGSGMERSMPMNGDQLLENRSLQSIIEDIQAEFETGGIYQPGQVTDTVLWDRYGLTTDQVAVITAIIPPRMDIRIICWLSKPNPVRLTR